MDKIHAFLATATAFLRAAIQSRAMIGTVLGVIAFLVNRTGGDAVLMHIEGLAVTWSAALAGVAALLLVIGRTFADGPLINFAQTFQEALQAIQSANSPAATPAPAAARVAAPAPAPASAAPPG